MQKTVFTNELLAYSIVKAEVCNFDGNKMHHAIRCKAV